MWSVNTLKTAARKARAFRRKFSNDNEGIAAIEFALIAPVMIMFYFGLAEVSLLVSADRKTAQAASLVGDLTAQDPTVDLGMAENYVSAVLAVIGTDAEQSARIGLELYSLEATLGPDTDGDGVGDREINEVGYLEFGPSFTPGSDGGTPSDTSDDTPPGRYDGNAIEDRLLAPGGGVVVARVVYEYESPYRYFVKTPRLREVFLLKPRRSATVAFENGRTGGTEKSRREIACTLTSTDPNVVDCNAL